MPAVFVNGNPESAAIWEPLLAELDRTDVLRLSPPGFGAEVPDGFDCTVPAYREWLTAELEALGEPVDLVAMTWAAAQSFPSPWPGPACCGPGPATPGYSTDYAWHDLARIWQTPGRREVGCGPDGGTLDERIERMAARGISGPVAEKLAAAQGPDMGRAILAFYRSAAQPTMAELGRNLPAAAQRPGLAIIGTEDHFVGSQEMRRRSAARAGARAEILDGLGHWWMVQDPARIARALGSFWAENGTT